MIAPSTRLRSRKWFAKKSLPKKNRSPKSARHETIRTEKTTDACVKAKSGSQKSQLPETNRPPKSKRIRRFVSQKRIRRSRLAENTAAVKTEKSQAKAKNLAAPGTEPDRQTLVAKKIEVIPAGDTVAKLPAMKKPAVRPRSDISEIKQPSRGESTAPSNKLIAATSNVASKMGSTTIPKAYDAKDKIDPFEPLFKEKPVIVKKKKNKKRIPQTPLERIDLSQLKLVGIIMASSGNRALVEESSGKGYVIKKGTYIGINSGKVVKIKKEKVVVEEEFEDVFGKTKLHQREIKLPKPPGEF